MSYELQNLPLFMVRGSWFLVVGQKRRFTVFIGSGIVIGTGSETVKLRFWPTTANQEHEP